MPARADVVSWARLVALPCLVVLTTLVPPVAGVHWVAPVVLFWLVMVVTVLCLIGAITLTVAGWRSGLAEVTVLGSLLVCASALPMVHGLTVPGILFAANDATALAAAIAVPCALLAGLPIILPRPIARVLLRRWRAWTAGSIAIAVALCVWLLLNAEQVTAPQSGSPVAIAIVAISLLGCGMLSLRHLRLYRIGRRAASLATAAGFIYLGLSTAIWVGTTPFSVAFWLAHVADGTGVFVVTFGLAFAHHRDRSLARALAPVVSRDPLAALELGMTDVVHGFVAALEAKDAVTRGHVVRVGELAVRAGERARLGADQLRAVGLAGLMHDVGKLVTPAEVLAKPGALDAEELGLMRHHAAQGAAMLAAEPQLAQLAPIVRSHHERIDGQGYPDGLAGRDIPPLSLLIAACDAWDAMTFDRPYRRGMDPDRAAAILRAEAAEHWGEATVELVLGELHARGPVTAPAWDKVGRPASTSDERADVCADALPLLALAAPAATAEAAAHATVTPQLVPSVEGAADTAPLMAPAQ